MGRKTKLGIAQHCGDLDLKKVVEKRVDLVFRDELLRVAYSEDEAQYYVLARREGFWKPLFLGTLDEIADMVKPVGWHPWRGWLGAVSDLVKQAAKIEARSHRAHA